MNLEQLAAHYQQVELPSKAYSTQEGYKNYLGLHVLPKWGRVCSRIPRQSGCDAVYR